jgi:ubiquinone/menaquinone biosynthesis C-methylase UbiE
MLEIARKELHRVGVEANLVQGSVENLPYPDEPFETIVNTMAFPGYPDGVAALSEMRRVLRGNGRLVLIDVNHPSDGNWLGTGIAAFWKLSGDLLRDMEQLFDELAWEYTHEEVGGWGSVHLFIARKQTGPQSVGRSPNTRTDA